MDTLPVVASPVASSAPASANIPDNAALGAAPAGLFGALLAQALTGLPAALGLKGAPASPAGGDSANVADTKIKTGPAGADQQSGDAMLQMLAQSDIAQALAQVPAAVQAAPVPAFGLAPVAIARDGVVVGDKTRSQSTSAPGGEFPQANGRAASAAAVAMASTTGDFAERAIEAANDKRAQNDPAHSAQSFAHALGFEAQQLAFEAPRASAPMPAPRLQIDTAVGAPGWDSALGNKVVWLVRNDRHVAELHLNPPELGPVQIVLTVNKDDTSAAFTSAHPVVRETIEAALPQLKDALANIGIMLGQTTVSAQSSGRDTDFQRERRGQARPGAADEAGGIAALDSIPGGVRILGSGLVDTFA